MARKIMIFAGAPSNDVLEWDSTGLLSDFTAPIATFAGLEQASDSANAAQSTSSPGADTAVWRSIPLDRERLHTGFSQLHECNDMYRGNPEFFTSLSGYHDRTSMLTDDGPSHTVLSRFYDHSLAIHDDIPSSQLPSVTYTTDESSLEVSEDRSTELMTLSGESRPATQPAAIDSGHLSDLEDIPNAAYLHSISPQTMTVNLIVGVISIAEPRKVQTRWGSTKSLIELIVGDETSSGFTVTFWLSPEYPKANQLLTGLRRQDIVLLRNVALGCFMKKVHGHSLRKGLTKIDLLYRKKLDATDRGGLYGIKDIASTRAAHPQLAKTRKVREWVINFVGGGTVALGKRKEKGRPLRTWDMPPDDTQ
ncbi:hypothetical protein F4780DRAFT_5765 [Xylariomycetidae sp. FL0641]|nr:hypothetical protein F4780DRAFT_5765 [Xylariomycetidae sp. FL0641]